jgi:hypothetical protein
MLGRIALQEMQLSIQDAVISLLALKQSLCPD